jgi:hypothetical protein
MIVGMNKFLALGIVAVSDIARSVWVFEALFSAVGKGLVDPWHCLGILLITGGLSLALLGLAMRAVLELRGTSLSSF